MKKNIIISVMSVIIVILGVITINMNIVSCEAQNKLETANNELTEYKQAHDELLEEYELLKMDFEEAEQENTNNNDQMSFYNSLSDEVGLQVYESKDLTADILENRNGRLIIEKCIGKCIDDHKNGEVMNCKNPEYNYISYSSVEGVENGNVVLTYLVYNPDNNYIDDIIERYDYIIDSSRK